MDQFEKGRISYPFALDEALFMNFAMLPTSPEAILNFANVYGSLYPAFSSMVPFSEWEYEINTLRFAVEVNDQLKSGIISDELKSFFYVDHNGRISMPFADTMCTYEPYQKDKRLLLDHDGAIREIPRFHSGSFWASEKEDHWAACKEFLKLTVDARLSYSICVPRLVERQVQIEPISLDVHLGPSSLLNGIWLQFACAIQERTTFKACALCERFFSLEPGITQSTRIYCSDACRVKAHRARKSKAKTEELEVPENIDPEPGDHLSQYEDGLGA
jgi:hypothetical protein